jgi:hypothetical protein
MNHQKLAKFIINEYQGVLNKHGFSSIQTIPPFVLGKLFNLESSGLITRAQSKAFLDCTLELLKRAREGSTRQP